MARTTANDVQVLLGDAYDTTYVVTPFITVANTMVTKHCVDATFTATELELIERYLAAWAYCISHPRATSESAKGVSQSIQHVEAIGINVNEFGQMAMRLDWSGALAAWDSSIQKGLRTSVDWTWAGIENDESQTISEIIDS